MYIDKFYRFTKQAFREEVHVAFELRGRTASKVNMNSVQNRRSANLKYRLAVV